MGSIATRYWLAQLPGWILAALVLGVAWRFFGLPGWAVLAGLALFVVKDVALYPLSRRALEAPPHAGSGALLGARGVAEDVLADGAEGRVRIGAEVWRAELCDGAGPLAAGSRVRVTAVRGLVVRVRAEDDA
jgi:membrane protein implicated in regulation of membrane protease activity